MQGNYKMQVNYKIQGTYKIYKMQGNYKMKGNYKMQGSYKMQGNKMQGNYTMQDNYKMQGSYKIQGNYKVQGNYKMSSYGDYKIFNPLTFLCTLPLYSRRTGCCFKSVKIDHCIYFRTELEDFRNFATFVQICKRKMRFYVSPKRLENKILC